MSLIQEIGQILSKEFTTEVLRSAQSLIDLDQIKLSNVSGQKFHCSYEVDSNRFLLIDMEGPSISIDKSCCSSKNNGKCEHLAASFMLILNYLNKREAAEDSNKGLTSIKHILSEMPAKELTLLVSKYTRRNKSFQIFLRASTVHLLREESAAETDKILALVKEPLTRNANAPRYASLKSLTDTCESLNKSADLLVEGGFLFQACKVRIACISTLHYGMYRSPEYADIFVKPLDRILTALTEVALALRAPELKSHIAESLVSLCSVSYYRPLSVEWNAVKLAWSLISDRLQKKKFFNVITDKLSVVFSNPHDSHRLSTLMTYIDMLGDIGHIVSQQVFIPHLTESEARFVLEAIEKVPSPRNQEIFDALLASLSQLPRKHALRCAAELGDCQSAQNLIIDQINVAQRYALVRSIQFSTQEKLNNFRRCVKQINAPLLTAHCAFLGDDMRELVEWLRKINDVRFSLCYLRDLLERNITYHFFIAQLEYFMKSQVGTGRNNLLNEVRVVVEDIGAHQLTQDIGHLINDQSVIN